MKTGSGFAASYTYEEHRNVKTAVSNSFGNTAVSTYTYEYDELGRRKSVKNTGSAFTNSNFNIYGYNDRSEVMASNSFTGEDSANKNNPLSDRSRAYNYDPIGNRKTATEAANNFSYTANSLNQYESISGGANPETPAYDLDGNMTVAQGMVYTYNAENRLIEAAPQNPQQGSVKSTYIYDYMGRRARKSLFTYSSGSWQKQKDISFIYDGWNMVKESEKTSDSSPEVPAYYVWGLDLSKSMQGAGGVGGLIASVKSGNEYLYSYDANGNVGQMMKSSDGSIAARYEYDPFGKTIFSEGPMAAENPYRFSTKYLDAETGFYYYGFRLYSPEFAKWINRDPIGEEGGINLNEFVANNIINGYDILGLDVFLLFFSTQQGESGSGHVGVGVGEKDGKIEFYEANPATSKPIAPYDSGYHQTASSLVDLYSKTHNYKTHEELPVLVLQLKTCPADDNQVIKIMSNWFKTKKKWILTATNCADLAKAALKGTKYDGGVAIVISTPQELAKDILNNNKGAIDKNEIEVIKGDLESFGKDSGVGGVYDKKISQPISNRKWEMQRSFYVGFMEFFRIPIYR